jgi:hypothetical protein
MPLNGAMNKNLNTGDNIVKLVLSGLVMLTYFTGVITGPFAHVLFILSVAVVTIFIVKIIIARYFID